MKELRLVFCVLTENAYLNLGVNLLSAIAEKEFHSLFKLHFGLQFAEVCANKVFGIVLVLVLRILHL